MAQVGVFVAIGAAAAAGFWNYYARPANADIETRQATLTQVRAEINRGLTTARRLPEFRRKSRRSQLQLDRLRAVLPEQRDVADLLNRINGMATESNLKILGFIPAATSEEDACTPSGRSDCGLKARTTTSACSSSASASFPESSTSGT